MQRGLLGDVVVAQCAPILKLLALVDESLLVGGNALPLVDHGLDVLDAVAWLHVEGYRLPRQRPDEDLHGHAAAQAEHEVQRGLLGDVVVAQRAIVFQWLAAPDESLLVRGNALPVVDLGLDVPNAVRGIHVEGNRLPRQRPDEDRHGVAQCIAVSCVVKLR